MRQTSVVGKLFVATLLASLAFSKFAYAQDQAAKDTPQPAQTDPTIDETMDAAQSDGDEPRRQLISWNEYKGPYFSFRFGGGFLYDFAGYVQDPASASQMELSQKFEVRDFRLLAKGFLFVPRLTYTIGYMYDKNAQKWRFRQTGLMVDAPELYGDLFVGRTKEGFSTSKIMVGYQGWTNERAAINDALIPILADGVKWMGYSPNGKFLYSLGWFMDGLSEDETFSKNDRQFVARAVYLPFEGTKREDLLHLVLEERYADSDDGYLSYRSKPESFEAQSYAIDTGKFAAKHSNTIGAEAYYRDGPLVIGTEYFINQNDAPLKGDPTFHGGEIFAAYLLTGETRPYNARGGYFDRVSPAEPVFQGGIGAWEAVLRFSYADLDSGLIHGGTWWRITPVMNWHLSDNVRLEFVTGYSQLDRFNTRGTSFYFQNRLQLQL